MLAKYQPDLPVNLQYQLLKLAWSNYQSSPETLDAERLGKLKQQVKVTEKIMTAVLASPAAQNEQVREQEVEFVLEQLQQQFEEPESFNLSLKQQQLSLEDLKLAIYQELLCEKTIDAQSQNFPVVTEQEALDYYQKNREKFIRPERRKVSHLLITINDEYAENKRAAAQLKIQGIRKELLDNIELFSEFALKYSECPTSLNKGLIGDVTRGQLYPELDAVLFTMPAQTISAVVESEIGFHLLLCHKIYPGGEINQEDALKDIAKQLNLHRKKRCEKRWLSSLVMDS